MTEVIFSSKPCRRGHTGPRYRSGTCIQCCEERYQKNRGALIDRSKDRQKRTYIPAPPRIKKPCKRDAIEWRMWWGARVRARNSGLPFEISVSDIVIPELCPVFGTPMESPNLDRKINHLGYTKENARIISGRANRLKSDASIEEITQILAYMKTK